MEIKNDFGPESILWQEVVFGTIDEEEFQILVNTVRKKVQTDFPVSNEKKLIIEVDIIPLNRASKELVTAEVWKIKFFEDKRENKKAKKLITEEALLRA